MKVLQEFRKFAVRGNVVDMAVGIIVGAAFTKIVSSAVADIITPPLGLVIGGVDFSKLAITLRAATETHPAVVLAYGKFIQSLIDFTIIAFVIFMLVRLINRLKHHHEQQKAAAAPPKDEVLLGEIRDLLQSRLPPPAAPGPGQAPQPR